MSETWKKPSAWSSALLIIAIFLGAFAVSCWGTLSFFMSSYARNPSYLIAILLIASGPIGFCWFFFHKLWKERGFRWIGKFAGGVVLSIVAWIAILAMDDAFFPYSVRREYPSVSVMVEFLMALGEFALVAAVIVHAAKTYAKYRGERIEELEGVNESDDSEPSE